MTKPQRATMCDHRKTEHVLKGTGLPVALRCAICTQIRSLIGNCQGCAKRAVRLPEVMDKGGARRHYCSKECGVAHANKLATDKAKATKAAKARQATLPGVK